MSPWWLAAIAAGGLLLLYAFKSIAEEEGLDTAIFAAGAFVAVVASAPYIGAFVLAGLS